MSKKPTKLQERKEVKHEPNNESMELQRGCSWLMMETSIGIQQSGLMREGSAAGTSGCMTEPSGDTVDLKQVVLLTSNVHLAPPH